MVGHAEGKPMLVLVAGDVVTDHYVYEGQHRLAGSTVLEGAMFISEPGGAGLVGNLLRAVAAAGPSGPQTTGVPRFVVASGFANSPEGLPVRSGFSVMQLCDRQRSEGAPKVWRVTRALGFSSPDSGMDPQGVPSDALDEPADVVVLDDAGLGFRRWPNRNAWPKFLREPVQDLPNWVVLKMSGPIAAGDLWHTIVSEHTQPDGRSGSPLPGYLGPIAERTIAVLSINDLRREFVRVDGKLSWERAAADLVQDLETHPLLQTLKGLRFVVIRLDLDGALVVERSAGNEPRYTLIFDPAGIEGSAVASVPSGSLFGYQSCLTAAIVDKLVGAPASTQTWPTPAERVISGVQTGLNAMRNLLLDGHEPDHGKHPPTSFPYARIARTICSSPPEGLFGCVDLPMGLLRASPWTIIAGNASHPPAPLWGLARRVAIKGVGQLIGIPYLQVAKLFSVDRSEIESFRTVQRLLTTYKADAKASKPLSIAAFGPPGSGKSFGVKQLAEALFDDKRPLEFNLSQFSTPNELHGLFHQIRDKVLLGQLPIVFWDEFDARNLDWLQYLLAPMQDGTFQDGQITHPIGKCVFVFAGGTCDRFEDFGMPPAPLVEAKDGQAIQRWHDDFKMKKGTDFKSRLAGYINVLGPNPRDDQDISYPVRRALLLRVHLGVKPAAAATIDPGLLDAFLRVPKYRHGSRSLEKIAEQVRLSARNGAFNRSDLPPRQQIDMHVDADRFLDIVEGV